MKSLPSEAIEGGPARFEATDAGPYGIGSDMWPGLSKLIEECGEVIQVAGKILGTGGTAAHWDGTDLRERLTEELADLGAAMAFVGDHNDLDADALTERMDTKYALFEQWHTEHQGPTSPDAAPSPVVPAGTSTPDPSSTPPTHATTHPATATHATHDHAPTGHREAPQPAAAPQPTSLPGGAT